MTDEKKFLQIQIDASRKQRWKDAVENEPEWRSMTHLIVTAVEQELRGGNQPTGNSGSADVDLGQVHDRFDSVQDQLNIIEDRLDETYFLVREDEDNYTEIANQILEIIPTVSDQDSLLEKLPEGDDSLAVAQETGSASHIGKYLQNEYGYAGAEIKHAIEQLERDISTVEATWANAQDRTDKRVYRLER